MPRSENSHRTYLNDAERDSLLKRLDAESAPEKSAKMDRRRHKRWGYRHSDIAVTVIHPAGGESRLLVCARNLSTSGLGFIHAGFLHKDSACKLLLRDGNGQTQPIGGKIVSCRHVDGMLHEIGVRFEKTIDVADFVSSGPSSDQSAQASVQLAPIHGRILYVDDCDADRELLKFLCQASGAEIVTAANGMEAMELVQGSKFAAIVTEIRLPGLSGVEFVQLLREMPFDGPIVGVSADNKPALGAEARQAGCNAVLSKPVDMNQLAAALTQSAGANGKDGKPTSAGPPSQALISSKWSDPMMRPLITTYVDKLEHCVEQMHKSMQSGDWEMVEKTCLMLKGSAGGYGYAPIGELATQLLKLTASAPGRASFAEQVRELNRLCAAAKSGVGPRAQAA